MTQKSPLLIMIRPALQSSQTIQALTKRLGRMPRVILNPLMTIQDLQTPMPKNLPMPFVFTSQNAVSITARKTKLRGDVMCVGHRVAKLAQELGFNPVATFQTAQALLDAGLPPECSYLRGAQVSVDIAKLTKSTVTELILYRQNPLPLMDLTRQSMSANSIIPVYSENLAIRLVDVTGDISDKPIAICISNKAAQPLRNQSFATVVVAPEPTAEAMIETLARYV